MLLENWSKYFGDCDPIASELRICFSERWVRFHYLPNSKRYAQTPEEFRIVLERYNSVLESLQTSSSIVVLTTQFSEAADHEDMPDNHWRSVRRDEYWVHIAADEIERRPNALDPLFLQVANDTITNLLIVDPACRWIFHPYDGGMDVIAESAAMRDKLAMQFSAWRSTHLLGL